MHTEERAVEYMKCPTDHRMRGAGKRSAAGIRWCEGVIIARYQISYLIKIFQDWGGRKKMSNDRKTALIQIVASLMIAAFSLFGAARIAASPNLYAQTNQYLDEKKVAVLSCVCG